MDSGKTAAMICPMLTRGALLLLSFALSTGCLQPQAAPDDLDGLARFFFDRFDPPQEDPGVSDVEMVDAFDKLHKIIGGDALPEHVKGTMAKMTATELQVVGRDDLDPLRAVGLSVSGVIHCTLDQVEEIILNPEQLTLYPEAYETYQRTFDADEREHLRSWQIDYRSSPQVPNQFNANVHSGLRRVPALPEARFGKTLVRRGFLSERAVFDDDENAEFTHDFQVETYHERAPGEVVHWYGIWRWMQLGVIDIGQATLMNITLDGMADWDKKTDELCAAD